MADLVNPAERIADSEVKLDGRLHGASGLGRDAVALDARLLQMGLVLLPPKCTTQKSGPGRDARGRRRCLWVVGDYRLSGRSSSYYALTLAVADC